jgi:hypothetical protein
MPRKLRAEEATELVTFRLPKPDADQLRDIAFLTDTSQSDIIRAGLVIRLAGLREDPEVRAAIEAHIAEQQDLARHFSDLEG